MLQKVTRLDSVPTAEETVLTTEVPTKESRLYTLLYKRGHHRTASETPFIVPNIECWLGGFVIFQGDPDQYC